MSTPPPAADPSTAWWVGALVLAAVVVVVQVEPNLTGRGTSFPGYWLVAREWLWGTPVVQLYDEAFLSSRLAAHGFPADKMFGPPTLVFTLVPFAWLPYPAARGAWLLLALGPALVASLLWLARPLGWWGLVLMGLFALGRPVGANMEVGQIYPLMLAAHCLGLWAWRRGGEGTRGPLVAGLAQAPMVALRGWYGLPQALGWLVGGRPWGFVSTGLIAAVLLLASLPLVGTAAWRHFLLVQLPETGDSPHAMALAYQTWRSLSLHLTTLHPAISPDPPLVGLGVSLWLAGVALIGGVSLWVGRRCRPGEDGGLGFALWTTVALILAPVAEDHHFLLAAVPVAVLWGQGGRRSRGLVLGALVLLLPAWSFDQPGLSGGWRSLLAYPRLYGTGLLWLGCVAEGLARGDREDPVG